MTDLIADISDVLGKHEKRDGDEDGQRSCMCGVTPSSDHSTHVARAIVSRLHYLGALLDEELTVLEGAE
jgi:hypothetical protein